VSAANDGLLRVWDLTSGVTLLTLEGHTSFINTLVITPDGQHAVSGSDDRTVRVWNLNRPEPDATFYADALIKACAAARSGTMIIAGDAAGCVHFLSMENRDASSRY
jgi:WD40 repeat protein